MSNKYKTFIKIKLQHTFVFEKLSYADLKLANNLIWSEKVFPEILPKVPALCKLMEKIRSMDGVKQYIANRPC